MARQPELFFEQVVKYSDDLIFLIDKGGVFSYVNQKVRTLGYCPDDFLSKDLAGFLETSRDRERLGTILSSRRKGIVNLRVKKNGGGSAEFLVKFSPLVTGGDFQGFSATAKDADAGRHILLDIAHAINNKLGPILAYSDLMQGTHTQEKEIRMLKSIAESAVKIKEIMEAALPSKRQARAETARRTRKKKVLLVEDEDMQLDLLRELLQRKDFNVVSANSGEEAMEHLREDTCDVMVTDIKMPGMNGLELIGWVKDNRPSFIDRVIITTGDTYNPTLMKYLEEERLMVVPKPYNFNNLLSSIEERMPKSA